jgi:rsbT co-antagonist protein RsbR
VYDLVAGPAEMVPEYLAFPRTIDDLGCRDSNTSSRPGSRSSPIRRSPCWSCPRPWSGCGRDYRRPLVGTLDSARTQLVTEKLLDTLVMTEAEHAVIDITGIPTVDAEVAQHLLKTVRRPG